MPRQRVFFGQSVHLRLSPRRFQLLFVLALAIVALIFIATPSRIKLPASSAVAKLSEEIEKTAQIAADRLPHPRLPKSWNPFGNVAHKPPEQADSDDGETRWYSDLKWLNPFSSQITLDEERTVLPPLIHRTPIYTYYDAAKEKDTEVRHAQNDLLLTWRRAWWAQGFKPVVLGLADAMKNSLYSKLERLEGVADEKELELRRWLAWEHMEGGILTNWLVLPMGSFSDPDLTTLRKGSHTKLTQRGGVLTASKENLSAALATLLQSKDLGTVAALSSALSSDIFIKEKPASSIARSTMLKQSDRNTR